MLRTGFYIISALAAIWGLLVIAGWLQAGW